MERTLPALNLRWTSIPLRRTLVLAAECAALVIFSAWLVYNTGGHDAQAYYDAIRRDDLYAASTAFQVGFLYSPAFAFYLAPLTALGFNVFNFVILLADMLALAYLVKTPLAIGLVLLQAPLIWEQIFAANVQLVVAAVLVLGLRHPWTWAFPLLTKVTPGVGLTWFAARREWRPLVIALGATVAVALPSVIVAPELWRTWFGVLTGANVGIVNETFWVPLWARMLLGVSIVAWGARSGRYWAIAVGVAVGGPSPGPHWVTLLAVPRLLRLHDADIAWHHIARSTSPSIDRSRSGTDRRTDRVSVRPSGWS